MKQQRVDSTRPSTDHCFHPATGGEPTRDGVGIGDSHVDYNVEAACWVSGKKVGVFVVSVYIWARSYPLHRHSKT